MYIWVYLFRNFYFCFETMLTKRKHIMLTVCQHIAHRERPTRTRRGRAESGRGRAAARPQTHGNRNSPHQRQTERRSTPRTTGTRPEIAAAPLPVSQPRRRSQPLQRPAGTAHDTHRAPLYSAHRARHFGNVQKTK